MAAWRLSVLGLLLEASAAAAPAGRRLRNAPTGEPAIRDAMNCAHSPGPGCGLSPSSTFKTWWPLTKMVAAGCGAVLLVLLLVRLAGGAPFRRCNRRECHLRPHKTLAVRLRGFKLHFVPSMEGLSPAMREVLHTFLGMFYLLLHSAPYVIVAAVIYHAWSLPDMDGFSKLTMAAVPAGHALLYVPPLLDAAHLATRWLVVKRLFKAASARVTARCAAGHAVSPPPSPARNPLAPRNAPASNSSPPAAKPKSPARIPGATETEAMDRLATAQCCTVVWDKGGPSWWQRTKAAVCFWRKPGASAPAAERASLQAMLRKLTKRVRRQTNARSNFRMVANTAGLRQKGQLLNQAEKRLREADAADEGRRTELAAEKDSAEGALVEELEACTSPDSLAAATAGFVAFSNPAANKSFQEEMAADPSLSHLGFATTPISANMRHRQLQISPSAASALKLLVMLTFLVLLGACLPGLFRGERAVGLMAGLRTVLTNGVPAVMPVAVNEGLISLLLIAGAVVGQACLCRTSRERSFATRYAVYMSFCFFISALTFGSPLKLLYSAVDFAHAVKGGVLTMAGNATMQTRYFWWEYLVTAIALSPAKPLFPMLAYSWLHSAFCEACDWLGTARYCNGDAEKPRFPSGDYIASTGIPPYVIASAMVFVSPPVGLLGALNLLLLFVVYSCMFRVHWFGTLDMYGAWTAWLWRMDSVCCCMRIAATFCAAWAVGAPAAALALHALPLGVLALTTWRLRPEAAALGALPACLAAEQCGDEEQPQDVDALLLLYLSKHDTSVAPVQQQAVVPEEAGEIAVAAEPLGSPGSVTPSCRRRPSSTSGGSPQLPSTLRRRQQQQQQPEAERSLGSPLRFSPAKSMR
ncbi:tRNA-binding protein isoform A [Chlorella sorokiniana]|uniref:tRNA-binding protein isoform A n=1 Tax=Chlorella sorokiniana TaxID=3076 RepID=A0A2P6U0V1_CHLSO|nr:tRNA-binding protein isoform B [Chlorella sorokiniana]PRW59945.1 tRNA-binding protein isoform A [Chlorella sorokiniana]|eukprot:PRW59944.1 tRNA-binding protein isoform B [Chlorella sorokiniana]